MHFENTVGLLYIGQSLRTVSEIGKCILGVLKQNA